MIKKLQNQIKNFFSYGWAFRNQFDWDNAFLEEMVFLKLKRMRACFNSETFHHNRWSLKEELAKSEEELEYKQSLIDQYKADVALDICIAILDRKVNNKYDKITGLEKHWKNTTFGKGDDFLVIYLNGVHVSKEWKSRLHTLNRSKDSLEARDHALLFSLMGRYSRNWWS